MPRWVIVSLVVAGFAVGALAGAAFMHSPAPKWVAAGVSSSSLWLLGDDGTRLLQCSPPDVPTGTPTCSEPKGLP